ncbi:MAG: Mpo1-like protein [Chloroflexota bacterium]
MNAIWRFITQYRAEHQHPLNAVLHISGVPMVGFGLVKLVQREPVLGLGLIALGYVFQFAGHKVQGTEVGEVKLAKHVWQRFNSHSHNESVS